MTKNWLTPAETEKSIDLERRNRPSNIAYKTSCRDRTYITNGKKSQTRYISKFHNVSLHLLECFSKYHTLEIFQ